MPLPPIGGGGGTQAPHGRVRRRPRQPHLALPTRQHNGRRRRASGKWRAALSKNLPQVPAETPPAIGKFDILFQQ